MEEIYFELDTLSDAKQGILQVSNYEHTKELVDNILEQYQVFEIIDEDDLQRAKQIRAILNKITKAIDRKRIDTIEDYTRDFKEQCNTLKELIDTRSKEFSANINNFNKDKKYVAEEYVAVVTTSDAKAFKKLQEYCVKNNLNIKVK